MMDCNPRQKFRGALQKLGNVFRGLGITAVRFADPRRRKDMEDSPCRQPLRKIYSHKNSKVHPQENDEDFKSSSRCLDTHAAPSGLANRLSFYVVTWNMNCRNVLEDLPKLIQKDPRCDFYVIGLQEASSNVNISLALHAELGQDYSLLSSCMMQSQQQLIIFCKTTLMPYITERRKGKLADGFGSFTGAQKGAIAVSFKLFGTSFLFISCHLHPHEHNVAQRNQQVRRIEHKIFANKQANSLMKGAFLKRRKSSECSVAPSACSKQSAVQTSDVVVWIGDMNYRVQKPRKLVDFFLSRNSLHALTASDQLLAEKKKGEIFQGFCEGQLSFRPTYKFDIGSDVYDSSRKERVPSWTDRILYKIDPSSSVSASLRTYDSISAIKASDHRPVRALLLLKLHGCHNNDRQNSIP